MAYLDPLLPLTKCVAWYPLDQTEDNSVSITDALACDTVEDESGNSRDLAMQGTTSPVWKLDILNGRKTIQFDGATADAYLQYDHGGAFSPQIKHCFAVVKVEDTTNFPASPYRGLVTGLLSAEGGIFMGDVSTTKWYNWSYGGGFSYYKSGTSYAESNQQAPFTNFELIEASFSGGSNLNGLNVGTDRDLSSPQRLFKGSLADLMLFNAVLTASERKAVELYANLKFGLWVTNSTTLWFPTPDFTSYNYSRFRKLPKEYDAVTERHEYEDGGHGFNEVNSDTTQFWEIEYKGLSQDEADVFDAFNDQARRARTFSFTDKWGEVHTGVRIAEYDRNHQGHRSWNHSVRFLLAKFIGG